MDDIRFIVEGLNRVPFKQNLTLVSFHSKQPTELLQVVNDVFVELDPKQKRDLRDEAADMTAARMIEFLMILNYKTEMNILDFKNALLSGNPEIIYPLLRWMLQRIPDLKKRAYLARFLRNVDVPEDLFADEGVVSLFQRYKELQAEFKESHKMVDKMRTTSLDPAELQKEINQLELEKEQLLTKMGRLKAKIEKEGQNAAVDFQALLAHTQALRKEQEEDSKLMDSYEEQQEQLCRSEARRDLLARKLQEMESSDVLQDPQELLNKLRAEVEENERLALQRLPQEIHDRERELHELNTTFSASPLTEEDADRLQQDIAALNQEILELTTQRDNLQSTADAKIGFYRDRASAVEKKLENVLEKVKELEDEKKETEAELRKLDAELQKFAINGQKPKTEAEMKQYMQELQEKTATYKAYKAEIQGIRNEISVLSRTESVLRSRDDNIKEFNAQLESQSGIAGYQMTQEQLEQVSALKSSVDNEKGHTLDEISKIVLEINSAIKDKKEKLAPHIKELRSLRTEHKTIETEYFEAKKNYQNAIAGLETERLKLEQEVQDYRKGLQEDESNYHFLNSLQTITSARIGLLERETQFMNGESRLSDEFKTYQEMYSNRIKEQEKHAKALREEQKKLKDVHGDKIEQRKMFKNLKTLLECKRRIQQETQNNEANLALQEQAFAESGLGVDRMVIQ